MGLPTSNTNTPGMLMQARKVNCVFVCMFHACVLSRHCVFVCVYRCVLDPFGQLTTHTHKYTHTSGQLLNKLFLWMIPPRNGAGAQAGQGGLSSACFSTHVIHKPKRRELADKFDSLIYRFQTYLYVLVFWFHHHRLLSFSNATCLSLCSAAMQLLSRPYRWSDEQWLKSTSGEVKVFGEVMCCFVCKLCSVFKCIKAAELWLICTKSDTIPSCSTLYFIMLYCCLIKNLNLKLTYVSTSFLYIQIIPWITFYLSSSAVQKIQLMIIFTVIKSTKY